VLVKAALTMAGHQTSTIDWGLPSKVFVGGTIPYRPLSECV